MGFYNVVRSCVVGKLHYTRPTAQPIEVDDGVAAPLVESGCLEPYRPGGVPGKTGTVLDSVIASIPDGEAVAAEMVAEGPLHVQTPTEPDPPKPRRGRRHTED